MKVSLVCFCSLFSVLGDTCLACLFLLLTFIFQVRGLEFNTISPNLLASGAEDGEICIWDLANPSEPSHFPPLRVRYPPSECVCVSLSCLCLCDASLFDMINLFLS